MNRNPVVVLGVVFAAIALLMGADLVIAAPQLEAPDPAIPQGERGGSAYCAALAGGTAGDVTAVLLADPGAPVSGTARVDVLTSDDEVPVVIGEERTLTAGGLVANEIDGSSDGFGLSMRWFEAPVGLFRSWEVNTPGLPAGRVESHCPVAPASEWHVPGLVTAGGAQATIVLANPFDIDAALSIRFTTPGGFLEPTLTQNVVVPAREVVHVSVNDHAPQRSDLGAVIEARAGRVVAEAYLTVDAAIGGIEGVTIVPATPRLAEVWSVPWFGSGEDVTSWAWVSNPTDRSAALTVTIHDGSGGTVPAGVEEIDVGPGEVRRIDLRGLATGASAGLTVQSDNGVPVAVSVATQVSDEDEDRTGLVVQLATSRAHGTWLFASGPTTGRSYTVNVLNPSAEPASVSLELVTPGLPPSAPRTMRLTPGAALELRLAVEDVPDVPALGLILRSSEGTVIASWRSRAETGNLELVASLGFPTSRWDTRAEVPPVIHVPELVNRFGTLLGPTTQLETLPDPADPEGTGEEDPDPGPEEPPVIDPATPDPDAP